MDGIVGLLLLIILVVGAIWGTKELTKNLRNSKLKRLLMISASFLAMEIFLLCWPLAGYGIYSFADYWERISGIIFDPFFLIIELGFIVAIAYFAREAYFAEKEIQAQLAIQTHRQEISAMEMEFKNMKNIESFVFLLENCDADVSELMKNQNIKNVRELKRQIKQKELEINNIKKEL